MSGADIYNILSSKLDPNSGIRLNPGRRSLERAFNQHGHAWAYINIGHLAAATE